MPLILKVSEPIVVHRHGDILMVLEAPIREVAMRIMFISLPDIHFTRMSLVKEPTMLAKIAEFERTFGTHRKHHNGKTRVSPSSPQVENPNG